MIRGRGGVSPIMINDDDKGGGVKNCPFFSFVGRTHIKYFKQSKSTKRSHFPIVVVFFYMFPNGV